MPRESKEGGAAQRPDELRQTSQDGSTALYAYCSAFLDVDALSVSLTWSVCSAADGLRQHLRVDFDAGVVVLAAGQLRNIVMLSRFVALSVSLTRKASLLQDSSPSQLNVPVCRGCGTGGCALATNVDQPIIFGCLDY